MRMTERAPRAGIASVAAVMIGGGVFLGVTAEGPIKSASAPAATASPSAPASYADVVRQVLPSVVLIRTPDGLGSGVVLDRSGNILTNAHVAGNATTLHVETAGDPAPRTARLVGAYPPGDLAVIRVDAPSGLAPARFGDSARARAGDVVLAVGNPLGLSGSVTEGIISATGRAVTGPAAPGSAAATLPGVIQTSAPVNPGNSGGALVNTSGQVIGIPTLAAASPLGGAQPQGIGFAIPSNLARDIARQIIASGHVTDSLRAAPGAQADTVTGPDNAPAGAGIAAVAGGGPSAKPGCVLAT
jgi:S1-C subfamily serine protease